jgi:hypothetical protein
MRVVGLLVGLFGIVAPAFANECQDQLTRAINGKDRARIEAFSGPGPGLNATLILSYRDQLETDFARLVVLKQQLRAIQEIQQGSASLGAADLKILSDIKARLTQKIGFYEAFAKGDADTLEPKGRTEDRTTSGTTPTVDRRPPRERFGTSAMLQMIGDPVPQPSFGKHMVVEDRKIEVNDPSYKITATWSELPQTIGPEGENIEITIDVTAKHGSISSGVQIRGDFTIQRIDGAPLEKGFEPTDLPVTVPRPGPKVTKKMVVHVKPNRTYLKDAKATLSIGVFHLRKVDYNYKVVHAGEP